jgi:hypothetical protein
MIQSLTNATTVKPKEIEPYDKAQTNIRHLDPEILQIGFGLYLHDDAMMLVDLSAQQPSVATIQYPALKMMLDDMFDAMWNIAAPIDIR